MTRRRVRRITFAPCAFLDANAADLLRAKLGAERQGTCPEVFVDHPVLVGRGTVAIAMPVGTWAWEFAGTDRERDRRGLDEMVEALKRAIGRRRFRLRDVIEHDGELYLRRAALAALASCRDVRAVMVRAALGLSDSLSKHPTLLRGTRRRPYRSLHDRKVVDGRRARGLGWDEREDSELRRAFGMGSGEPGRRLSKRDWHVLLDVRLQGIRTRDSVLGRVARLRRIEGRTN